MSRSSDSGGRRIALGASALVVLAAGWLPPRPAAADPTAAEGPTPGAPVIVQPGDRFVVEDMHLPTGDRAGIAQVDSTPSETRVRLDATVLFAKDAAEIQPAASARLAEVASQLRSLGPGSLTVTGYTDDLGSAAHGLVLSRRRASAVADRLRPQLASDRITVVGRGEADPVVPNDSEAHRRLNRRVVVVFRPR